MSRIILGHAVQNVRAPREHPIRWVVHADLVFTVPVNAIRAAHIVPGQDDALGSTSRREIKRLEA